MDVKLAGSHRGFVPTGKTGCKKIRTKVKIRRGFGIIQPDSQKRPGPKTAGFLFLFSSQNKPFSLPVLKTYYFYIKNQKRK